MGGSKKVKMVLGVMLIAVGCYAGEPGNDTRANVVDAAKAPHKAQTIDWIDWKDGTPTIPETWVETPHTVDVRAHQPVVDYYPDPVVVSVAEKPEAKSTKIIKQVGRVVSWPVRKVNSVFRTVTHHSSRFINEGADTVANTTTDLLTP